MNCHLCPLCGAGMAPGLEFCPHHIGFCPEDWAKGNRAFCEWLHRGQFVEKRVPFGPWDSFWWQSQGF